MTSEKDTRKPRKKRLEKNLSAWAQERARLLREAVNLALCKTRRAGRTCAFKTRHYEAIRAEYAGRELPGGRRLRLSPSRFVDFICTARRGGAGAWGFLTLWKVAPDPIKAAAAAEKRAARSRLAGERRQAQAARRAAWEATLAGAAPVDPAEAITAGEALAGRRLRGTWQERRAAILTLALHEIETAEAAGFLSVHRACRLAARHYGRADIGDGHTLRTSPETLRRALLTWQAGGRTPEAIRLKYGPCQRPARITEEQAEACADFGRACGLTPSRAAAEIARRFILPISSRRLADRFSRRGLPRYRRKCAAQAPAITAALDRLAGIFPERARIRDSVS